MLFRTALALMELYGTEELHRVFFSCADSNLIFQSSSEDVIVMELNLV